jgi:hypothetical protein
LESELHSMTPIKHTFLDTLLQYHEPQQLQVVWPKATGPRRIFAKKVAHITSPVEEEDYGAVIITTNQGVECQVSPSDRENDGTTFSIADTDRIVNPLEKEIHGIKSNKQMWFKLELSIR